MTLKTTISCGIKAEQSGSADLASAALALAKAADQVMPNGTANGQSDKIFADQRTLSGSSNEDLDLAGGVNDFEGNAITFAEVTSIFVQAGANNGGNIEVSPAAANGFLGPFGDASDKISLAAGEKFLITNIGAGWTVTGGTGDLLNIANTDGSAATYDIVVAGRSA